MNSVTVLELGFVEGTLKCVWADGGASYGGCGAKEGEALCCSGPSCSWAWVFQGNTHVWRAAGEGLAFWIQICIVSPLLVLVSTNYVYRQDI